MEQTKWLARNILTSCTSSSSLEAIYWFPKSQQESEYTQYLKNQTFYLGI